MFHFTKRLWLTSRPTEHFSVPTLQLGVKVVIEEPTIVRTSLTRHLFPEKSFITKVIFILFITYFMLWIWFSSSRLYWYYFLSFSLTTWTRLTKRSCSPSPCSTRPSMRGPHMLIVVGIRFVLLTILLFIKQFLKR